MGGQPWGRGRTPGWPGGCWTTPGVGEPMTPKLGCACGATGVNNPWPVCGCSGWPKGILRHRLPERILRDGLTEGIGGRLAERLGRAGLAKRVGERIDLRHLGGRLRVTHADVCGVGWLDRRRHAEGARCRPVPGAGGWSAPGGRRARRQHQNPVVAGTAAAGCRPSGGHVAGRAAEHDVEGFAFGHVFEAQRQRRPGETVTAHDLGAAHLRPLRQHLAHRDVGGLQGHQAVADFERQLLRRGRQRQEQQCQRRDGRANHNRSSIRPSADLSGCGSPRPPG